MPGRIVVKVGGSVLHSIREIIRDLKGREFVLVHGIGPQMDKRTRELGREPQWYNSASGIRCRYTDMETRNLFVQMAAGMSAEICAALQARGIDAESALTCLKAKRKERIKVVENGRKRMIEGDYTGRIEQVDADLLKSLLERGYAPVVPPFAVSENNELVNVNGDRAAAHIARALGADTIVNLSNVPGVFRDGNVIDEIRAEELEEIRSEVNGGMSMKLLSAREALDFGVNQIVIASGNVSRPVTKALAGEGTVILNES